MKRLALKGLPCRYRFFILGTHFEAIRKITYKYIPVLYLWPTNPYIDIIPKTLDFVKLTTAKFYFQIRPRYHIYK